MDFSEALTYGWLYEYGLGLVSLVLVAIFLIAEEGGYRIGLHHRSRLEVKDAESGGGGLVQNSLFAVLGLILAFTYAAAVDRHENRRQAVVQEANALGTAYLRADTLREPSRTELKESIFEYAVTRMSAQGKTTAEQREAHLDATMAAQQKIWPLTLKAIESEERAPFAFGLVDSINEVLDQNTLRLDAVTNKLPAPVLYLLILISTVSLAITGFNAGVQGHLGRWRAYGFATLLVCLLIIIMDFDRPGEGLIRPSGSSLNSTIADMKADLAN